MVLRGPAAVGKGAVLGLEGGRTGGEAPPKRLCPQILSPADDAWDPTINGFLTGGDVGSWPLFSSSANLLLETE